MIDDYLLFSEGQSVGTGAVSTNNVNIKVVRDIAAGQPLRLRTSWAGTMAGATTVEVQLRLSLYPVTWANGTAVTVTNTGNIVTLAGHGLSAGADVFFSNYGGGGLTNGTVYYVTNPTTNTFQLASTEALALAGTSDIDPDADDASVNMSHYTAVIATTGAVSPARWNVLKEIALPLTQVSGAADMQTLLLSGAAAGASSKWKYLSLNYSVVGSAVSGATATSYLDIAQPDHRKYYPTAIVVQ